MDEERILLVRVLDLERHTGYYQDDASALRPGDHCVVDHGGPRLGVVVSELTGREGIGKQLDRVVRTATPSDLDAHRHYLAASERLLPSVRAAVARHSLPMHLVAAEYTLDGSQLRIYFTAPHRVDFRSLLRELAASYSSRIELRQMGTRDETRIKGGLGRCGRIVCCSAFLHDTKPVPMELAYDQELFVSPERITGICGRLMCCLAYEHGAYKDELAQMPKLGARVTCRGKEGKVIAHNIFRRTVTILTEDRERIEVDFSSVRVLSGGKKPKS